MDKDVSDVLNLQYKVAIKRESFTKTIEKLLKKKNDYEIKKISNIRFEDWEESNIEVPQFNVPEVTQVPVIEKQKIEKIKGRILEQMRLMKIIEKRRTNKIAQLVDEI